MIATRSLMIRVDRAWRIANSCVPRNNKWSDLFQGNCSHYYSLSFFNCSTMDRKKKVKTMDYVWKRCSTESSSEHDVEADSEKHYVEVTCNEESEVGVQVQVLSSGICGKGSEVGIVCDSLGETVEEEESKISADVGTESIRLASKIGSHSVSVEVPASLLRFVKGKGGSIQKEIEEEIGVKLIFPSSKKENCIVVEGDSTESVTKASNMIHVIIEEAVKSPNLEYSHFISLPLAIHPDLVDKLTDFQNAVLGNFDCGQGGNGDSELDGERSGDEESDAQFDGGLDMAVKLNVEESEHVKVEINKVPIVSYPPKTSNSSNLADLGIDRSIFIKPKTFHLTVLMLKLWSDERVVKATEVLQRVSSKVVDALENRPVYVRLKGLECMRGSLAKARVLYTPVEVIGGEDRLLHACQIITEAYAEAGLVLEKDARQKLKLHGTVMNAKHRKRTKGKKISDPFDARDIVKQYGSKDWGEYLIREAHLSQRFVYDENGFYHCCTSIPFPQNSPS